MQSPTELFRLLADPTRCRIYERLAIEGEMNVAALTAGSGVSQPAVSQHLAALKAAKLVEARAAGRAVYYRPSKAGLKPVIDWMAHYRAFWDTRFDRLEQLLDRMDP
jgi:DNA-binding transcriptional ArsR family regulator